MTSATARRELAAARADGFCPFCFARSTPGVRPPHEPGCKIINDACLSRKKG